MFFDYLNYLNDWLAPTNSASWARPLFFVELVVFALAMIVTYWPQRFAGAVTTQERWLAGRGLFVMTISGLIQLLAVVILPIGIVLVVFSPARPTVLVLNSQSNPSSIPIDENKIPESLHGYRRINIAPIVQEALRLASKAGASEWSNGSLQQKSDLRDICLRLLQDLREESFDGAVEFEAQDFQLPRWVKESVEISIVHGLCLKRNIRFVGVWTGPETPGRGWSVASRLPMQSGTEIQLFQSPSVDPVRVLSAFGGEATLDNTQISFVAIVSHLPTSGNYQLPFRIVDRSTGTAVPLLHSIPQGSSTQLIKIDRKLTGFSRNAHLDVELEDGRIRAELPMASRGTQLRIAVFGESSSQINAFQNTWEGLLGIRNDGTIIEESPLRENLIKAGKSIPYLSFTPTRNANQLGLYLNHPIHCISLFENGLEKDELNEAWFRRQEIALPRFVATDGSELAIDQSAWRASEQFETASTLDSWMSTTVLTEPSGSELWVPTSYATSSVLTSAIRTNTPLLHGRYFSPNLLEGGIEARYPFVELHRVSKRIVVVIRLDCNFQQFLAPESSDAVGQSKYEYSRSVALVNSIILAANRLSRRQVTNEDVLADSQTTGQTLLDLNSCVELTEMRVKRSDDLGLLCIAAFCFVATLTGLLCRWPKRVSTKI